MSARTCIGCREVDSAKLLLRFVAAPDDTFAVFVSSSGRGGIPGRGASLHARKDCIENAIRRRAFSRAFRSPTALNTPELCEMITTTLEKRWKGLISAAQGKRAVVPGNDAVEAAWRTQKPSLLLLALDAKGYGAWRMRAQEEQIPFVNIKTKQHLGSALHRRDTGVAALRDDELARELERVFHACNEVAALKQAMEAA